MAEILSGRRLIVDLGQLVIWAHPYIISGTIFTLKEATKAAIAPIIGMLKDRLTGSTPDEQKAQLTHLLENNRMFLDALTQAYQAEHTGPTFNENGTHNGHNIAGPVTGDVFTGGKTENHYHGPKTDL